MGVVGGTLAMHGCIEPAGCACTNAPFKPEHLTPRALTKILRGNGAIPGNAEVKAMTQQKFGEGEGLLSVMYRLTLDYGSSADPSWPKTLVCKLTPPQVKPRVLGEMFGLFEAEVKWYDREMAEKVDLPGPKVYYASHEGYGRYVVIMEDLAPAKPIDQFVGASARDAESVVKAISGMHAAYRGRVTEAKELQGLGRRRDDAAYAKIIAKAYHKSFRSLNDQRYESLGMNPTEMAPLHAILSYVDATCDKFWLKDFVNNHRGKHAHAQFTNTLCHGDLRGENVFLNAGAGGLKVIDYQLVTEAPGAFDVSYFLSNSLTVEERREHEVNLIRCYHQEMHKQGATDLTMEEVLLTFQRAIITSAMVMVIAQSDASESERANQLINMTMTRVNVMAQDWNLLEAMKLHDSKLDSDGVTSKYTPDELRRALPAKVHALLQPSPVLLGSNADVDKPTEA